MKSFASLWFRRFLIACIILIAVIFLLGACLVAAYSVRESRGRKLFVSQVEELRKAGYPVDDATMDAAYRARTDDSHTDEWMALFRDFKALEKSVPHEGVFVFDPKILYEPFVGVGDWPYEEASRNYLQPFNPVIEKTRELTQYHRNVYFPTKFSSFSTELEYIAQLRGLTRLSKLDGLMSIRDHNSQRLIDDIITILNLSEVSESGPALVCKLVSNAIHGAGMELVEEAFEAGTLGESELRQLQIRLLEEVKHAPQWNEIISEERAIAIPVFMKPGLLKEDGNAVTEKLGVRGWDGLEFLDRMKEAESVSDANLDVLLAKGKEMDRRFEERLGLVETLDTMLTTILFPSLEQVSLAAAKREHRTRVAAYAVACKMYMLQNGKAPESLSVLTVPHEQLVLAGGKPPGYRVTESGDAQIWHFDLEMEQSTPAEPPPLKNPESLAPESFTWTIPIKGTRQTTETK